MEEVVETKTEWLKTNSYSHPSLSSLDIFLFEKLILPSPTEHLPFGSVNMLIENKSIIEVNLPIAPTEMSTSQQRKKGRNVN